MRETLETLVISPTFNEVANVDALADGVLALDPSIHLMVVDDSSPDGTADRVRLRAQIDPRVHLLLRTHREGYGRAVAAGLAAGLEMGARRVLQMDADGSHDTSAIPSLIQGLEDGADMVIGSRYIPGGGIGQWPLRRRLLSRGANVYVDRVLGLPVRDCTSGFRGFHAETLRRCGPQRIRAQGYAFLIEHLYHVVRAGLQVREVPILFTDREAGTSNLSLRVFAESVINPWRIRLSYRR